MKRVLILSNHHSYTYNFRKEIIRELIKNNYKVYVVLPYGEKVELLKKMGCEFIDLHLDRRGINPFNDLKLIKGYYNIMKKVKPDVVLSYTIKPNVYGGLVCRILNIPYINNITGLGSGFNKGPFLRFFLSLLYKFSLKKSSCVFFQNEHDMKNLVGKKIVKSNYKLIPGSGVNLDEYKFKEYPKDEPITFLFNGRIMKEKGIDQFLEAARAIKEKFPKTKFNIIGFVEETQPHYENLIQHYQEKGYVNYLGFQYDVKPYIEEAHCIIQASHGGEGLSNVLLEAGATGRALIASDIPGCRETIENGINGFLFMPQNTLSLTQSIEKFVKLPYKEKKRMGFLSRKKIEREFDRNIVVEAYLNEIKKIFEGKL